MYLQCITRLKCKVPARGALFAFALALLLMFTFSGQALATQLDAGEGVTPVQTPAHDGQSSPSQSGQTPDSPDIPFCHAYFTVHKAIEAEGETTNGVGWSFKVSATGGSPSPTSGQTGNDGDFSFSVALPNSSAMATVQITEEMQNGYDLKSIHCTKGGQTVGQRNDLSIKDIEVKMGDEVTCTFTNGPLPKLKLVKEVTNDDGGDAVADNWTLSASADAPHGGRNFSNDGGSGDFETVFADVAYSLSESGGPTGYEASDWTCDGGEQEGNQIILALGDEVTCTITNNDIPPQLTVIKHVVNDDGGTLAAGDFTMQVTASNPSQASFPGSESGTTITLDAGSYSVDEGTVSGYAKTLSDECTGTIAIGESRVCTITNNDQKAALTLDKTASPSTYSAVGDVIDYSYRLTNSGEVTLSAPFTVDDDKTTVTCPPTPTSLAPGEFIDCTATYVITQADLNAGQVKNTAQGHATFGETQVDSNFDDETVTGSQAPSLIIDKSLTANADEDGSGDVSLGDTLTYGIVATNNGNITLTNVTVTDTLLASLTCSPSTPATLSPGASVTCTGQHVVTQADVDAGQIVNTATADSDQTGPVSDTVTVTIEQHPSCSVNKEMTGFDDADHTGHVSVGDTLTYQIVVVNDGNVTLPAMTVDDPLIPGGELDCTPAQPADLAPGEQMVCTGAYVVTQADADAGRVINTVTVGDDEVADEDVEITVIENPTAIDLVSFTATAQGDSLLVRWVTDLEVDTWGYHLDRNTDPTWEHATRITASMIPSKGQSGGAYEYMDSNVAPGVTYYYWLVEIQNGVEGPIYGPVNATAGAVAPVTLQKSLYLPYISR